MKNVTVSGSTDGYLADVYAFEESDTVLVIDKDREHTNGEDHESVLY